MASPTRCTWVWVKFGSWWWTERPGMLRFMGLQRVRHDWATELNWGNVFAQPLLTQQRNKMKQTNKKIHQNQEVPLSPGVKLKPKSNRGTTEHIPTSPIMHLNILQPRITEDEDDCPDLVCFELGIIRGGGCWAHSKPMSLAHSLRSRQTEECLSAEHEPADSSRYETPNFCPPGVQDNWSRKGKRGGGWLGKHFLEPEAKKVHVRAHCGPHMLLSLFFLAPSHPLSLCINQWHWYLVGF